MSSRSAVHAGIALLSLGGLCAAPASHYRTSLASNPLAASRSSTGSFGLLPLAFERNVGQAGRAVSFLSHTNGGTLLLSPAEAVLDTDGHASPVTMKLVGANTDARPQTADPLPGQVNYLLGADPSKWRTNVQTNARAGFHDVYPGIDVVYYGNRRRLEYDFAVRPHAASQAIGLRFPGARQARTAANGDLVLTLPDGDLRWQRPIAYQSSRGGRREVSCRYRLEANRIGAPTVRFTVGAYDEAQPLIIDPALISSTFLGGGGGDSGTGIAIDPAGSIYITGAAHSTNYPISTGAYQRANRAGRFGNAFVSKISADGTTLLYSTFLGGTPHGGGGDYGAAIAVDASGNAYIAGGALSTNFPITASAYQTVNWAAANNVENAFVAKLNPSGGLVYSTYLGGSGLAGNVGGDVAAGIALDGSGSAYVTGSAFSVDFPVTPGAFQTTNPGRATSTSSAYVAKLSADGKTLVYSTYLGGNGGDNANAIAVNSAGNACITGATSSTNFPTTSLAYQRSLGALSFGAAFVTKLSADGKSLVYSTYLGGNDQTQDYAAGIALDSSGNAYVTGLAGSSNFPVTPSAYQRINRGAGTNSAFLTKVSADGRSLVYSTFLGGRAADYASAVAVDSSGNACIVGTALALDFPTTLGSYQRLKGDRTNLSSNAFVAKFDPSGATLLYSTLLSGLKDDSALAVALDASGKAVVTGNAGSATFPTTPGAFQTVNRGDGSGGNAFVTRLSLIPFTSDVDHDGWNDLILQNQNTGQVNVWYMQGTAVTGGDVFSLAPPLDFPVVGMGDFLGDGSNTLVLQNTSSNQIALWYTAGSTVTGGDYVGQIPGAGYRVVGVADMNHDDKPDIIFQNQTTNQIAIWFMNGNVMTGGVLIPYVPPAGWRLVGAGDLSGDGKPDLVFQNQTTNQLSIWLMDGSTFVSGALIPTPPAAGWQVVGVSDSNGDGKSDLIFQNKTTNQLVIWYMDGTKVIGGSSISYLPPLGWRVAAPR